MELSKITQSNLQRSVSLSGMRRQSVRTLAGFQKHHRIPDGDEPATRRFLSQVGNRDIETDLDQVFVTLKQEFGFKRREMKFSGPIDGSGLLSTPSFDYRIDLIPEPEQRDTVQWRRTVDGIRDPDVVMSAGFSSVFANAFSSLHVCLDDHLDIAALIDHVEDSELPDIKLEYDRDATWCELQMRGLPGCMQIEPDQVTVTVREMPEPACLLNTYLAMQNRLMESINPVSG